MKRNVYLGLIIITIILAFVCLFSGCKKEEQHSCGVCNYIEHYSHNDSTFEINGNKFCDSDLDRMNSTSNTYNDTINGVPTIVNNYYKCSK